jgi:hypothetical protein
LFPFIHNSVIENIERDKVAILDNKTVNISREKGPVVAYPPGVGQLWRAGKTGVRRNEIFTAHFVRGAEDAESDYFSFTAEKTVNENHQKLCFLWFVYQNGSLSIESNIRGVA